MRDWVCDLLVNYDFDKRVGKLTVIDMILSKIIYIFPNILLGLLLLIFQKCSL